MFQQQKK